MKFISFSSFNEARYTDREYYFKFKFNGNVVELVSNSTQGVFKKGVLFLYENGYKFNENVKSRRLLNLEEIPASYKPESSSQNVYKIPGTDKYILCNFGPSQLIGNLTKMLELFGINPDTIETNTVESQDLLNVSKMTFIEAAQTVLKQNNNKPMSSRDIWTEIEEKKLVNTSGTTPWATLNATMLKYSDNSNITKKYKTKLFHIVSDNPVTFQLINPEQEVQGVSDDENLMNVDYYLLGAYDSKLSKEQNRDLWRIYVEEGKWYNGFALAGQDTLKEEVNNIPEGSRVAIKSTYTKQRVNPAMMIKAIGTVTKNYKDGTQLDVDWDDNFKPFEIMRNDVGAYRRTLHKVTNDEHINLIWENQESAEDLDFVNRTPAFELPEDDVLPFSHFRGVQSQEEKELATYLINPFRQSVCILGKSGRGKSTTIDNMLEEYSEMNYDFIIPTSSTTGLLSQFSPSAKEGKGGYVPSRLGKMIMQAHQNPNKLYTAVFDECHKSSVIEMINDELLQCISTKRNRGNRFISLDTETESLFSGLKTYRGNLLLPDNFGFIFLSSKPDVITSNADFFNRVDIYVLKNLDYKSIDYSDMIIQKTDEDDKPIFMLNPIYFHFIPGKTKEDVIEIEKLNDEE